MAPATLDPQNFTFLSEGVIYDDFDPLLGGINASLLLVIPMIAF